MSGLKASPTRPKIHGPTPSADLSAVLSERQAMVLRALVAAYVGQAGPVASHTLSLLTPSPLSPASIRNTLAELHEAGLIDKAHASAGRVPTKLGLRVFIDHLLELVDLGPHRRRMLDRALEGVDAAETPRQASHLLSEHSRQLGFVMAPRVEHQRLRKLQLIRVSTERVLVILITENGGVIERIIEEVEPTSRRDLERIGRLLAERVSGRTLVGLRELLESERQRLQGEADDLMRRVWAIGLSACKTRNDEDLVIGPRLALLDQPEFADPVQIRGLFAAIETNQRLLDLLRQIAQADAGETRVGLSMSLGEELGEPSLSDCVLMAVSYGPPSESGVLGVIGPQRMDYGRVIPLVSYCSELVTRKLLA